MMEANFRHKEEQMRLGEVQRKLMPLFWRMQLKKAEQMNLQKHIDLH